MLHENSAQKEMEALGWHYWKFGVCVCGVFFK